MFILLCLFYKIRRLQAWRKSDCCACLFYVRNKTKGYDGRKGNSSAFYSHYYSCSFTQRLNIGFKYHNYYQQYLHKLPQKFSICTTTPEVFSVWHETSLQLFVLVRLKKNTPVLSVNGSSVWHVTRNFKFILIKVINKKTSNAINCTCIIKFFEIMVKFCILRQRKLQWLLQVTINNYAITPVDNKPSPSTFEVTNSINWQQNTKESFKSQQKLLIL